MRLPLALIAGIPLGVYQRTQQPLSYDGWDVQTIPSQNHRKCDFEGISKRVLARVDEAETSTHDGVHLFVVHDGRRARFKEDLRSKCYRVVWFPPTVARRYGQPEFDKELGDLLAFESAWRTHVRPSVDSPLLLPEGQFATDGSTKDMWGRVYGVAQKKDDLGAVAKTVSRFRRRHHHQRGWRDTAALVFVSQERHGTHGLCAWRRRKFTFALPEGFHFNVAHEQGRRFELASAGGARASYSSHANVDAYGYMRGGG